MDGDQYFLIPFYEYMKTIIGVTTLPLKIGNCNDKHIDFKGNFITEFTLNFDNNHLLTESRKHNSNKFDIRLVMRFCKNEDKILEKRQISMVDCFPQNLKVDINSQPVKLSSYLPYDRFRKPGRMNPRLLDITNLIFDNHSCTHTCNINWVQDDGQEQFNFALYLVRRRSFEELSNVLINFRIFSVQNTINLLSERTIIHPVNNKSNIEYMFQDRKVLNASLVCPLSLSRMKIPVRGGNCTHLKCFDLLSFLIINFQKPTWNCPICDKKAFFCLLKIDGIIFSIINDERSNLMEEIKFNEHGQWKSYDEDSSENSDTDSFYDIPGIYYNFEINNEQCNGGSNTQRCSETISGMNINKDAKNILPMSDWRSLKNEYCCSNNSNMVASLANNTISNVNSKSLSTQNIAVKKSIISNGSQSNPILNSKTLVFQEKSHQTNLNSNSNNNSTNNLKRTHVNSSSESSNEKELPVKKPTLDSRSIPKVNGSKTVTESVHNDQPNNTDSEMADNLITNYNQPRSRSGAIIQVINKEKYVYGQIESQLFKEIRQYHNFWFYETTNIPNNFKFFDAPKRKIFITTINSCEKVNLFDVFPDIQRESKTSDMWIHSINKPFNIFISGAPTPIYLEKHTTLEITNGDGREKRITFQTYKDTTIIMIEILYLIKPSIIFSSNEPSWTYNVNLNDFKCMKSFIRLQLSQQQEDKLTYFVAAHYATLRETLHPAVVTVTVLNFEGELIMNSIITPRNPIKHYQSHVHGLKEEQIRNNWDSEDFKAEIRKVLDGRILVGLVVKDFLEAVDFPLSRVLGIRDLGSARCFEKLNLLKCSGTFRIRYLEKQFIPNEKSVKVYLQSENDVQSIRKIYIKLRDQWEDHIFPEEQCETLLSPMITMQDKKDLMTNKEKIHILQKNEDSKVVQSKISILSRNKNTNATDSEISIISVTKSNLEIIPDMEIKKERSKNTVLEEQMRKRKELLQPVEGEDNCFTISAFNDLDFPDPIYWQQPEDKWKPHITHYMDKEVKQSFISNQEKARNLIEINGAPHLLSSLVYVNKLTGEPLVVSYRFGAKAICVKGDQKSISKSPGHSSKS